MVSMEKKYILGALLQSSLLNIKFDSEALSTYNEECIS